MLAYRRQKILGQRKKILLLTSIRRARASAFVPVPEPGFMVGDTKRPGDTTHWLQDRDPEIRKPESFIRTVRLPDLSPEGAIIFIITG